MANGQPARVPFPFFVLAFQIAAHFIRLRGRALLRERKPRCHQLRAIIRGKLSMALDGKVDQSVSLPLKAERAMWMIAIE